VGQAAPSILDAPPAASLAAVKLLGATPVNSWAGLTSVISRKNSLINACWAAGPNRRRLIVTVA
jgi:hypothetical protein